MKDATSYGNCSRNPLHIVLLTDETRVFNYQYCLFLFLNAMETPKSLPRFTMIEFSIKKTNLSVYLIQRIVGPRASRNDIHIDINSSWATGGSKCASGGVYANISQTSQNTTNSAQQLAGVS